MKRLLTVLAVLALVAFQVPLSFAADTEGIVITYTGPSTSQIAIGGRDQALVEFTIEAGQTVDFNNFPITLLATEESSAQGLMNGRNANLTDIKLVNTETGEVLAGPVDVARVTEFTDSRQSRILFDDVFTVEEGEPVTVALTADFADQEELAGMLVRATLNLNTVNPVMIDEDGARLSNRTMLTPHTPIVGSTMIMVDSSLEISLASTPVSGFILSGQHDVSLLGMTLTCGETSDCTITSAAIQAFLDDDGDGSDLVSDDSGTYGTDIADYVSACWLEDMDGNQISDFEAVSSTTGEITFESLSFTIDAGSTMQVTLMGDISSGAYANGDGENLAFAAMDADAFEGEDADGNSLHTIGDANVDTAVVMTTVEE
ncbi:MAG: hypothetical protein WC924_03560 [Candidatus Gracilibacteria bacterium]